MPQFKKFKFLIALKLNFNGGQYDKKIKFWLFQKVEKSHIKIVKFKVENFEHLRRAVKFEVQNFEHLCQTQNMSAFKQQISICSFFCAKK